MKKKFFIFTFLISLFISQNLLAFEKKAETLDNSMDTYTKEVDGFEITLADGYYPLEIAKFDESEWK